MIPIAIPPCLVNFDHGDHGQADQYCHEPGLRVNWAALENVLHKGCVHCENVQQQGRSRTEKQQRISKRREGESRMPFRPTITYVG